MPNKIFVPIPSVPETKRGSLYPHFFKSKIPPKPPTSTLAPGRAVDLICFFMELTNAVPASISTPASL